MSGIVLATTQDVDLPPSVVFESFAGAHGGWLFNAACDRLAVGQPISLDVPFGRESGSFAIYGRISRLSYFSAIDIEHVQPWRGRIRVRITDAGGTTSRVSLSCDVDDEGIAWLIRRAGIPAPLPRQHAGPRIGLLTSKTGPGAVFALATENAAILALEELNADRPTGGRFELVVGDDATDPVAASLEVERLALAGCRAIVASVTSASFAAVQRVAQRRGILAIQPLLNEGGGALRSAIRLGERPDEQIRVAAGPIMRATGDSRWFIVGHTYSWSIAASRVARTVLPQAGGMVVGEARVPLDNSDFNAVVDRIARSGAGLVLTTLVGAGEVRFEHAMYDHALRQTTTTLSLVFEEATREHIGIPQSNGVWSAMAYFENLQTAANVDFVRRYRSRFGRWAPPLSSLSESVYTAILLLERAWAAEPDGSPPQLIRAMREIRRLTPRGLISFGEGETYRQATRVAVATPLGFRLTEE